MNIPKAIELLEESRKNNPLHLEPDTNDALKISIEAMKFIDGWRQGLYKPDEYLLPGETRD